ncbi:MAG: DUF1992 domain-containing protein [Chloroflexota bacterium]|nr:DUF1992 domain-containing protein [Chloroflexota bacterium]MDE2899228.1 DUF1992 domain-containing protein [Chloroflexota bacterium]
MDTPPDRRARRRLDEAAASGLFERTAGRGKPLNLAPDDPNVPADLRLAFRLMRNANVSPPWIALAREVEQELDDLRRRLALHERRMRDLREALVSGRAADFKDAFKSARERHVWQRREFERLLDETRQRVDKLAATAPDGAQRVMFRPAAFLERFDTAWPWPERTEDERRQ